MVVADSQTQSVLAVDLSREQTKTKYTQLATYFLHFYKKAENLNIVYTTSMYFVQQYVRARSHFGWSDSNWLKIRGEFKTQDRPPLPIPHSTSYLIFSPAHLL